VAILAAYLIGQAFRVLLDLWLVWWAAAKAPAGSGVDGAGMPAGLLGRSNGYWVWTGGAWCAANAAAALARSCWCAELNLRASRALHTAAVDALLAAPLRYFQENPTGRILNRLSTDMHHVDVLLPDFMFQVSLRLLTRF